MINVHQPILIGIRSAGEWRCSLKSRKPGDPKSTRSWPKYQFRETHKTKTTTHEKNLGLKVENVEKYHL